MFDFELVDWRFLCGLSVDRFLGEVLEGVVVLIVFGCRVDEGDVVFVGGDVVFVGGDVVLGGCDICFGGCDDCLDCFGGLGFFLFIIIWILLMFVVGLFFLLFFYNYKLL